MTICPTCETTTATHYADICEHDEIHDQPSPLQRDGLRYSREDD
jgi:hypothetical protein